MRKKLQLSITFLLSVLVFSCSDKKRENLPDAIGKLGSMVIVAEKHSHKELQSIMDSLFMKSETATGSSEAFFDLIHTDADNFLKNNALHRTVLVLVDESSLNAMDQILGEFSDDEISKLINDKEAMPVSKRNVYAKFQHIVYLFGKNSTDLKNKLIRSSATLSNMLMSYEIQDKSDQLNSVVSSNQIYFDSIKNELGLGVRIPAAFKIKYHNNNTWWFEQAVVEDGITGTISLVMHAYPYSNNSDLSYLSVRSVRDSVCKYLIRGEIPGTYMGTTESNYYPPAVVDNIKLNNRTCTKVRGWWTVKGISQAGPYLRYVISIPETKTLFAFEGFIYKPELNFKERDLRLIESIALSIK